MKLLESNMDCLFMAVAPRAGAWIETLNELPRRKNKWQSPPVRGRGLKLLLERLLLY